MQRAVYSWLIALHPAGFRRRFGPEMLAILDEPEIAGGSLLLDAFCSLVRQWGLRTAWWRGAIALLLAGVPLFTALIVAVPFKAAEPLAPSAADLPATRLIMLEVATLVVLVVCVASVLLTLNLKKRSQCALRRGTM
jgi:hypothetical protein